MGARALDVPDTGTLTARARPFAWKSDGARRTKARLIGWQPSASRSDGAQHRQTGAQKADPERTAGPDWCAQGFEPPRPCQRPEASTTYGRSKPTSENRGRLSPTVPSAATPGRLVPDSLH